MQRQWPRVPGLSKGRPQLLLEGSITEAGGGGSGNYRKRRV